MKTTRLLFTMLGCAMLLRGVSRADPSSPSSAPPSSGTSMNTAGDHSRDATHTPPADDGKPPADGKPPQGNQDDRRAHGNSNDRGSTTGTVQAVGQQDRREHSDKTQVNDHSAKSPPANASIVHQPVSIQPVEPAKPTPARNKTDNVRGLTAQPPSVIQPAGLLLKTVHNRGPVTAVIGGPANAKNGMSAAISGTSINHKP